MIVKIDAIDVECEVIYKKTALNKDQFQEKDLVRPRKKDLEVQEDQDRRKNSLDRHNQVLLRKTM